ncbi:MULTISPECIES: hypothetical protein [Brevibacillus]|uniref:hypothetical protein n=1 Tax=Brevibacillus TaxID=55080 RepID=UPI000B9BFF39|nr:MULTISPECIES: hypothetical protein [Brevibacillus]MBG9789339.1 hypothetical protein [Brevibacillus laterosporus]MCG7317170.1 hypothetical protein [Brevibacillus laterosporus]RFB28746.1 hypothetical protein DZB91_21345 [Brevibacillus sp. VP]
MFKKVLPVMFTLSLIATGVVSANEPTQSQSHTKLPQVQSNATYYYWKIIGTENLGKVTKGDWIVDYIGYPAKGAGEVDSFSISTSYSHSVSGSIQVGNDIISATVGYEIGDEVQLTVQKASRPLAKGEYVKASYRKTYLRTLIDQQQYFYDLGNTYPQNKYAKGYADEAIKPEIKLDYYKTNASLTPEEEKPYFTEIFEYVNGEYVKVSEQTH